MLIDTNVIIDFLLDREPDGIYADEVFRLCGLKKIDGFIAAHSFPNMFYILRKDHSIAARRIMLYYVCNFADIVEVDKDKVYGALKNFEFADFEDCLQMECAVKCGADYIVTRNVKDFLQSGVKAVTPEDFLKLVDKR